MDRGLTKLAGDLQGVLKTSARELRKLANDHAAALKENEALEHENAAMKLARRMEQRNIQSEYTFEEKVAKLLETPRSKLALLEQAIEIQPGGFRLGKVAEAEDDATATDSSGDELGAYIMSQAALQP